MKIGVATFVDVEGNLFDLLETVRNHGINAVELRCEWPLFDPEEIIFKKNYIKKLKELLQTMELTPLLHASYIDVNLASTSDLLRTAAVKRIVNCVKVAYLLDAKYVTLHMGYLHEDYLPKRMNTIRKLAKKSLISILNVARDYQVKICIENKEKKRKRHLMTDPYEIMNFIDSLNNYHEILFVTFDVGHANTWGCDLKTFFDVIREKIRVIHLHDNHGTADEHLALGEGSIDFDNLLPYIVSKCNNVPLILEIHTWNGLLKSINYVRKKLTTLKT
ncbi:MAG: sugar phosphate isomerase/epimerase [Candidatus Odinarchaeota archaeon]|nr:sugar phosphate isomerase/epimerase [Candidatus Odinarchaeota archaeon]